MLSAPTRTAPAASMRAISVASRAAGARSRLILEPARVGSPSTSNRFFTANGTPASGPTDLPAAIAASISAALARARSAVTSVKAFSTPSRAAIRDSAASVASLAESLRVATAAAMALAVMSAGSSGEDTGRLGFIRQGEFVDQLRHFQRHVEIGADRRTPSLFDRQPQGAPDRVDVVIPWLGHAPLPSMHRQRRMRNRDRKSTRLNSSHQIISYAVF